MDQIINNPGLQHIIEIIFFNLDFEDLMACQLVNKSIKNILKNQMFWLKKWRFNKGLSKTNQNNWIKALKMTKNTNLEKNVALYIKKIIKIGHFVDVPCYIDNDAMIKATEISFEEALEQGNAGVLQILAPKTKNFNAPKPTDFYKTPVFIAANYETPVFQAARLGNIDVVKALAPLIENPNYPPTIKHGYTPIQSAAYCNKLDIVRFLAALTDNPNEPDRYGNTPIHYAAVEGHLEVVRYLATLTDNPNVPDNYGNTPIQVAALNGHLEVVRFLAPLTENPNAPDEDDNTAIDDAEKNGHYEIVRFLQSYNKN